jgi:hypothetical protein
MFSLTIIFQLVLLILLMVLQLALSANVISPVTIEADDGGCPSQEKIDSAIQSLAASIQLITFPSNREIRSNCGPGHWHRVTLLNMSDPLEACPSSWSEYNVDGVRACGRPSTNIGNCSATFYVATGHQYSRVCGRVIGYQIGGTDRCLWWGS